MNLLFFHVEELEAGAPPRGRLFVERTESVELHQLMPLDILWREHNSNVFTLKIHHYKLVKRAKLSQVLDKELPIAFDLSARIPL